MKNTRTLLTTSVFDAKDWDPEFLQAAAPRSLPLRFLPVHLSAQTAALAAGSRAVCAFVNDRLDAPCLKALKAQGVGLVALRCTGYNQVDLKAAARLGLRVTRVPAYSPHAVAEHAVALYLCLNRHLHRADRRVREFNFSLQGLLGEDLAGKTVGIVGAGKIGRIAAQIFRGFGTTVLVCDPQRDLVWARRHGLHYVGFAQLLKRCDVISLHAPLTPRTHHLMDAAAFARMKPGAVLINTSRGALVDTPALVRALKKDSLGGVALDVYEEEAEFFFEDYSNKVMRDDQLARLLTFSKVLMTSHQGFFTRQALAQIADITVENLRRFAGGMAALKGTELVA